MTFIVGRKAVSNQAGLDNYRLALNTPSDLSGTWPRQSFAPQCSTVFLGAKNRPTDFAEESRTGVAPPLLLLCSSRTVTVWASLSVGELRSLPRTRLWSLQRSFPGQYARLRPPSSSSWQSGRETRCFYLQRARCL